jgi:hypothetical protein
VPLGTVKSSSSALPLGVAAHRAAGRSWNGRRTPRRAVRNPGQSPASGGPHRTPECIISCRETPSLSGMSLDGSPPDELFPTLGESCPRKAGSEAISSGPSLGWRAGRAEAAEPKRGPDADWLPYGPAQEAQPAQLNKCDQCDLALLPATRGTVLSSPVLASEDVTRSLKAVDGGEKSPQGNGRVNMDGHLREVVVSVPSRPRHLGSAKSSLS